MSPGARGATGTLGERDACMRQRGGDAAGVVSVGASGGELIADVPYIPTSRRCRVLAPCSSLAEEIDQALVLASGKGSGRFGTLMCREFSSQGVARCFLDETREIFEGLVLNKQVVGG